MISSPSVCLYLVFFTLSLFVVCSPVQAEKRNSMTNAAISLASKAAIDWVNLDYYTVRTIISIPPSQCNEI